MQTLNYQWCYVNSAFHHDEQKTHHPPYKIYMLVRQLVNCLPKIQRQWVICADHGAQIYTSRYPSTVAVLLEPGTHTCMILYSPHLLSPANQCKIPKGILIMQVLLSHDFHFSNTWHTWTYRTIADNLLHALCPLNIQPTFAIPYPEPLLPWIQIVDIIRFPKRVKTCS